jgi:hypothetical protein
LRIGARSKSIRLCFSNTREITATAPGWLELPPAHAGHGMDFPARRVFLSFFAIMSKIRLKLIFIFNMLGKNSLVFPQGVPYPYAGYFLFAAQGKRREKFAIPIPSFPST